MTPVIDGNSALFLDIDGTLLDLAPTPETVVVPASLKASLAHLHAALGGALAFISGRSLAGIDRLFAPLVTAAAGSHGVEIRGADGRMTALAPRIPEDVRAFFQSLADDHPGVMLEDKGYALSLHYRAAPDARPALEAALEEERAALAAANVGLLPGKAVIDARPMGIDKGVGLRTLLGQPPFAGRRVLFGGDDITDMDVFRILPELGGHGFSVGRRFAGAEYIFPTPAAVRDWLSRLAREGVAA